MERGDGKEGKRRKITDLKEGISGRDDYRLRTRMGTGGLKDWPYKCQLIMLVTRFQLHRHRHRHRAPSHVQSPWCPINNQPLRAVAHERPNEPEASISAF